MNAAGDASRMTVPGLLLVALVLRLWDLARPFIGDHAWNEAYYAQLARGVLNGSLFKQIDFDGHPVTSSPLVPWIIAASFRAFGTVEWAGRLPMLLAAMAGLILFYVLARTLYGQHVAGVALCLAASAPGLVFFSRNIQLDGIMTSCGLLALLALARYRSTARPIWLVTAVAAFAIAILVKFSGVLFLPPLAWLWFEGVAPRRPRRWFTLAAFLTAALLPSLAWLTLGTLPADRSNYFVREFDASLITKALLTVWPRSAAHLGFIVWYPSVIAGLLVLAFSSRTAILALARRHAFALLLIAPWYAQIGYPDSWVVNEYYDYPALFGACLLIASLWLLIYRRVVESLVIDRRRSLLVAMCCAGLVTLSNAWDYRTIFHRAYFPWPIIAQPSPFHSARLVAAINQGREPVLTDVWFTCYYADCAAGGGRFEWWGRSDVATVAAIASRTYAFVVFTYPPTIAIANAIQANGYVQIAPAAWRRSSRP